MRLGKRVREQQQKQQEQGRGQDSVQREQMESLENFSPPGAVEMQGQGQVQEENQEHQEEARPAEQGHEPLAGSEQLCIEDFIDFMPHGMATPGSGSDLWSGCGTRAEPPGTGLALETAAQASQSAGSAAWAPGLLPSPSPSHSSSGRLGSCGSVSAPAVRPFRTQAQARAGTETQWTTALHIATRQGHDRLARVLLEHGAGPNERDSNGQTALHVAAHHGHERLARVLLEHGADVDAVDGEGWTPLHRAAESGDDSTARLLLARDWAL